MDFSGDRRLDVDQVIHLTLFIWIFHLLFVFSLMIFQFLTNHNSVFIFCVCLFMCCVSVSPLSKCLTTSHNRYYMSVKIIICSNYNILNQILMSHDLDILSSVLSQIMKKKQYNCGILSMVFLGYWGIDLWVCSKKE